jgi:hypothetical protein
MGSVFSKPKAPDTSAQQKALAEQEARIKQQETETKRRDAAAMQARRARVAGRQSLLTSGETGVTGARETLG